MLVVTSRPGESVVIELPPGELTVASSQVKLGTDAPDNVLVLREELLEQLPATDW